MHQGVFGIARNVDKSLFHEALLLRSEMYQAVIAAFRWPMASCVDPTA